MQFSLAFLVGCLIASLGEYWVHRLQHLHMIKGEVHANHHQENVGQGVLREFCTYAWPSSIITIPLAVACYYLLPQGGMIGWLLGAYLHIAFSAWTHQVQHTDPRLVFWSQPLHYFHHNHTPNHNFGFNFSCWDRLFGTYKPVKQEPSTVPWGRYWEVKWI